MSSLRSLATRIAVVVAVTLAAPTFGHAQTHLRGTTLTPDVITGVFQNYYRAPMPERVHEVVQAAIVQGLAETRPKRLALIAFMAGLIADNTAHVERLASVFGKLPGEQPERLVRAILYSGRPDWADQITRLKNLWPQHVAMIDRLAERGARPVYALKRDGQPEVLDMNWAYFGTTGSRAAVHAVIEMLGDLRASDPAKVAMAHAARHTLATQAMSHERVYEVCLRAQMGSYGDQMRLIIVASNNKDVSTFKTDAEAAIAAATAGKPVPVPEALIMTTRSRRP
jgi:hypothetical protein